MANRLDNIKLKLTSERKRYYKSLRYPEIPLSINDTYVITTVGDRLDSIAYQFYNDVRLWWVIATANPNKIRRDSYNLKPNLEIRIPSNIRAIVKSFEELNR